MHSSIRFRVAASLNRFIFEAPKTNDALLFMTILSTDLNALKRRGYNGDHDHLPLFLTGLTNLQWIVFFGSNERIEKQHFKRSVHAKKLSTYQLQLRLRHFPPRLSQNLCLHLKILSPSHCHRLAMLKSARILAMMIILCKSLPQAPPSWIR